MKRALFAALFAATLVVAPPISATAASADNSASLAWFEDHWIDLAEDWEDATACDVSTGATVCFRTEAELDEHLLAGSLNSMIGILAVCGSTLRLYDGTSYGGTVLSLSTRNVTHNLSTYGFDNMTSSYKVGACDSDFYSAALLGGSLYSGNTAAFAQATAMLSGWNNVVSSVYIA